MKDFKNVKILNNYFESCIFFPMPTTLIGTLDENKETSFGAYSLVFPYYIGHKDFFSVLLISRNTSNTSQRFTNTWKMFN